MLSAIGGILFLIGFIASSKMNATMVLIGIIMVVASELIMVYLTRFEDKEYLLRMKEGFLRSAGSAMAMPVLLFVFYILTKERTTLVFSFALGILSFINV